MHRFFLFGCHFGAVGGWGMILRLGPAQLGLWEDPSGIAAIPGLGALAFLKQYTNKHHLAGSICCLSLTKGDPQQIVIKNS